MKSYNASQTLSVAAAIAASLVVVGCRDQSSSGGVSPPSSGRTSPSSRKASPSLGKVLSPSGKVSSIVGKHPYTSGLTLTGEIKGSVDLHPLAFSPDNRVLAVGDAPGYVDAPQLSPASVQFWDSGSGKLSARLSGHLGKVRAGAFTRDGKTFASGDDKAMIKLWDVASGSLRHTLRAPSGSPSSSKLSALAFSPRGDLLASSDGNTTISFWNPYSGKLLRTVRGYGATVMEFSPDGRLLATGMWGLLKGSLRLYEHKSRKTVWTKKTDGPVIALTFAQPPDSIVVLLQNGQVLIMNTKTGKIEKVRKVLQKTPSSQAEIDRVSGNISPGGRWVAVIYHVPAHGHGIPHRSWLLVADVETQQVVARIRTGVGLLHPVLSSHGLLATGLPGYANSYVQVWSLAK